MIVRDKWVYMCRDRFESYSSSNGHKHLGIRYLGEISRSMLQCIL